MYQIIYLDLYLAYFRPPPFNSFILPAIVKYRIERPQALNQNACQEDDRMGRIIKDADKLDFDYVPDKLPHREKELAKLTEMYSCVLDTKLGRHSFITGGIGYGKTVLANYFFQNLRDEGRKNGVNVELVFVNCKASHTPARVMNKVMADLKMSAGKNQDTMTEGLKKFLIKNDSRLCVIMDEAHIPLKETKKEGDRVIFCLSRINEIVPGPKVSVSICLVSSKDVLSLLEESTRGVFKKSCIIELKGYSRDDLKDILVQRVELAFHPGTISTECLDLLADISSGEGEARYGIELLLNAGLIAQQQGADGVTAEHIRRAKAEVLPYVTEELLRELNDQERLTLLAVARNLKKQTYTTISEVRKTYRLVCEGPDVRPYGNIKMREILKTLESRGIIDMEKDRGKRTGKLKISIPDTPAEAVVEWVENNQAK